MSNENRKTYTVEVTRDDKWWSIHVLEIDYYTQAESGDDIEMMARDLIEIATGKSPDSFNLEIIRQ